MWRERLIQSVTNGTYVVTATGALGTMSAPIKILADTELPNGLLATYYQTSMNLCRERFIYTRDLNRAFQRVEGNLDHPMQPG